jgi:DNA-binding NarL/FixJ family response regulator
MDSPNVIRVILPAQVVRESMSPDRTAGLVTDVLGGPVDEDTRQLLVTAGRGDPAFTVALIAAGLVLGALAPVDDGRWAWRDAARLDAALRAGEITAVDLLTLPREPGRGPEPADPPAHLTPRESDVLELLQEGLTARAIARQLDLSTRTVSKYQERLYRKLGTSDRLTTVLVAQRLGLVVRRSADGGAPRR